MARNAQITEALKRWRADRMAFRKEAIIMEDGQPFGEVMDSWQAEDFAALDSGIYRHAYLERPRGHSKTGDMETEIVTDLFLGPPNQDIIGTANDEDQARIPYDGVIGKIKRNPLLAGSVEITKREIRVKSTGSRYRVLNSDAGTSWGLRPDRVWVDEPAEIVKRNLWDALWTASGKRPHCRVFVIGTAGWDRASLAWEIREMARTESDWLLSARGQCASWIRKDWLEQQRRTLPAHVFARLHESRWVDGVGAFLTADEVDFIFSGQPTINDYAETAGGIDIGLSNDRTVVSIVRRYENLIVVTHLVTWAGKPGRKVDLEDVEREVLILAKLYQAPFYFDPYQGELLAQRLRRQGVTMVPYTFSADGRRKLFSTLLDLIRGRRLKAQPHEELRRELLGLEVSETAAGWRVDHKPGRHDDHVVAVALAVNQMAADRTVGAESIVTGDSVASIAEMRGSTDGLLRQGYDL